MISVLEKHRQRAKTGGRGQRKPSSLESRTQSSCLLRQGLPKLVTALPPPVLGIPWPEERKTSCWLVLFSNGPLETGFLVSLCKARFPFVGSHPAGAPENLTFIGSSLGAPLPLYLYGLPNPTKWTFTSAAEWVALWPVGITGYIY